MMITKFVMLVLLITSLTVSTQLGAINNSLGQNAHAQSTLPDDTGNTTNDIEQEDTFGKENYQNFSSDFRNLNDTNQWTRISGIWNYSLDGVQGSIKENVSTPINIITSPINSTESNEISTSFAINEIADQGYSYVSIIYALQDPFNYRQAGINIQNGSISVFANTINDDVTTDTFMSPIPNSSEWLTSGNPFSMSLLLENNKKTLFVNGLEFQLLVNNENNIGKVGLGYGGMQSITFFDFLAKNAVASSDHSRQSSSAINDNVSISLNDKSIPEGSYMPIYDSRPYKISDGHISAKLPCNEDSSPSVQIMVGNEFELSPIELKIIPDLSDAGSICLYEGDIITGLNNTIYDIMVQNTITDEIDFPDTSSIAIGITKLDKSSN